MRRKTKKQLENEFKGRMKTYLSQGLWTVLNEFLPFMIKRDNGELVYVVVYGLEDHMDASFFVFPNDKSFATFDHLFNHKIQPSGLKEAERYFSQDALAVIVDHDEDEPSLSPMLSPINQKHYGLYRFRPHYHPNEKVTRNELELANEVVDKLNRLALAIKNEGGDKLAQYFHSIIEGRGILPVLEFKDNTIGVDQKIIDFKKKKYRKVRFDNELLLGKLRRLPKYGKSAIEIYYSTVPIEEDKFGLKFVNGLIYFDSANEYIEPILVDSDSEKHPKDFVTDLAQELTDFEKLPKEVIIRDEKTKALLSDLLGKLDIEIVESDDFDDLDQLENEIFFFESDDMENIYNMSLPEIDDALDYFSTDSSPYSKRVTKSLTDLKESIIDHYSREYDINPEDYNPNFGFETYYFKYSDNLGNNCFIRTPDRISLSDTLKGVYKVIKLEPKTVKLLEPKNKDLDKTISFMRLKAGDLIQLKAEQPQLTMTLELDKIIPESCESLQVYSETDKHN